MNENRIRTDFNLPLVNVVVRIERVFLHSSSFKTERNLLKGSVCKATIGYKNNNKICFNNALI